MAMHLYLCEGGGPMTLAVDGTPPQWVTCPVCVESLTCERCPGAQLQGEAPTVPLGKKTVYRCSAGHERGISTPIGAARPESTQCPECGGMLMPIDAAGSPAAMTA